MKLIPYGRQFIDNEDIKSVSSALKKDIITTGKLTSFFEKKINSYLNCNYSSTCNSGTSAIYLALLSINVKKNDIIIMPVINFVSSYNIARSLGAKIYLADVDINTGQMTPSNIIDCCNKFKIKKAKAIITMYNGGYPWNADQFKKLKKKLRCFIIEDSCHAFGAQYKYKNSFVKIGSCLHSDISTFSFHPLKTITTGEGGLVTTNSKYLDKRIKMFRSLGIKRSKDKHWDYDVIVNGFNFRMNDFQCALGLTQLSKIHKFLNRRKQIALKYEKKLKEIKSISIPDNSSTLKPSFHLYLVNFKKTNFTKKEKLFRFMKKNGVMLQYHYIPLYKFQNFKGKYISKNAEIYYKTTFSLPIFYQLSNKNQNYIIKLLREFFFKN